MLGLVGSAITLLFIRFWIAWRRPKQLSVLWPGPWW